METAKLRSQLSSALEQATAHLEKAHDTIARLGIEAAGKLQDALPAAENVLHKLQANVSQAAVVTNRKIAKLDSQLSVAFGQMTAGLQKTYRALATAGRSFTDKPRQLHEARLAREDDLRTLLASSVDAIIVTDSERRLVAANSLGLHLFGVSELNMRKFTIGTFFSPRQILAFDRNRSAFLRREERHGKCKIRRLDGTLRVAECVSIANVVPHRDLYRFLNVAPDKTTPWRSPANYTHDARKPHSQHHKAS